MKILILVLVSVGVVWSLRTQPTPPPEKEQVVILLEPRWGSRGVQIRTSANEGPDHINLKPSAVPEKPNNIPMTKSSPTTTNAPVTDNSIPIDLSQRLFHANYDDSQFDRKTLDLSGLDLSGEDIKKVLYSLNSTVLESLARLDLSHNRVWSLPSRIWPLPLEYNLQELRLDYNWLSMADPFNSRTTRFELTRLRSLKKLSLSHCRLGITLENIDFPPIEVLDLSGNQLVQLPSSLATLATLQHLDASNNRLRYLSGSPLGSLTGLLTLNLSHNGLETLWDDPLEKLYSLETLNLDHNALIAPPKLYHFTGSYQPKMDVYMSGNPFSCVCAFKNTVEIGRLQILDKLNVTCKDESGAEWSVDDAQAHHCSPNWETVREKWSATREWFQDNRPDWSTLYRSLGWLLFGVALGLIYAYRRGKKTSPPASQVPYNILDNAAGC